MSTLRPSGLRALSFLAGGLLCVSACSGGSARRSTPLPPSSASESSSPASASESSAGSTAGSINWTNCGKGVDCGTLAVPIDRAKPATGTVRLALVRRRAKSPSQRIGAVLVNPGGPGASGVQFVESGSFFSQAVQDRFDIIGFDPRGVGGSGGITCGGTQNAVFREVDWAPDTPAEQRDLDTKASAVGADCAKHGAPVLAHLSADDVVDDMDAIRAALGETSLNFVGYSYGTMLGQRYLARYPRNARAIVLDGVVDPTQDLAQALAGQTRGFEEALDAAFAECPAGGAGCPPGGAAAAYDRLAAQVDKTPLRTDDPERRLGPTSLATAALYTAYSASLHSELFDALSAGLNGDGQPLLALAKGYEAFGDYAPYAGVECVDTPHPPTVAAWAAFSAELAKISPRFGPFVANEMLPCVDWPVPVHDLRGYVSAPEGPGVLVIGTTGDPATPYSQAVAVAEHLAHGRLLTYKGEGHTAGGSSACADDAVSDYLISRTLPKAGTICRN